MRVNDKWNKLVYVIFHIENEYALNSKQFQTYLDNIQYNFIFTLYNL